MTDDLPPLVPATLTVAFIPGVTIRKWTRIWDERHPDTTLTILPIEETDAAGLIRGHDADLAFIRLPLEREGLSVIRLYGEVAVVVVPRDHEFAGLESVSSDRVELLEKLVRYPTPGPVKDAVALVAAGVGALTLPHSLARLNARKDVAAIPIDGAAETDIALVWLAENTTPAIEEFVGIVRGRTAASSRASGTDANLPARTEQKSAASPQKKPKPHRITGNRAQARNRKGRGGR